MSISGMEGRREEMERELVEKEKAKA